MSGNETEKSNNVGEEGMDDVRMDTSQTLSNDTTLETLNNSQTSTPTPSITPTSTPTSTPIPTTPSTNNQSVQPQTPPKPNVMMDQEKRLRREIANSNERRRMQSINSGFQSLRSLLPHTDGEKLSKAAILQHAAELIQQIEQEKSRLFEQNLHFKRILSSMKNGTQTPAMAMQSISDDDLIEHPPQLYVPTVKKFRSNSATSTASSNITAASSPPTATPTPASNNHVLTSMQPALTPATQKATTKTTPRIKVEAETKPMIIPTSTPTLKPAPVPATPINKTPATTTRRNNNSANNSRLRPAANSKVGSSNNRSASKQQSSTTANNPASTTKTATTKAATTKASSAKAATAKTVTPASKSTSNVNNQQSTTVVANSNPPVASNPVQTPQIQPAPQIIQITTPTQTLTQALPDNGAGNGKAAIALPLDVHSFIADNVIVIEQGSGDKNHVSPSHSSQQNQASRQSLDSIFEAIKHIEGEGMFKA